jgi:hypothetical protein
MNRCLSIRKLLAEGKILSSEDFSDASLTFQHGQIPNDFLFCAHFSGRSTDPRRLGR